ncbi:hypothetical protein CORMATOL_00846 [Corynebacterium matruchotii ATCC 33806]|uniref:Uncharacterized protein n=1 Tax=Corynebacterium matruchotii ATCC 33806 TaxID=566549 RepID=C0E1J5_9CORY|nr:hypothetical protein CORMATOL_00846 [Corynebacterium matruchotii ATCC 33806]
MALRSIPASLSLIPIPLRGKPLFPEAMTTGRSEMSDLFFVIHRLLAWPLRT